MMHIVAYFTSLFAQPPYVLTVAGLCALGVAYAFAWFFENWMHGAVIFPPLMVGALAAVDIGRMSGLIFGRDQDITILLACGIGVGATLPILLVGADLVRWLTSYDRRAFREMLNRNQPQD